MLYNHFRKPNYKIKLFLIRFRKAKKSEFFKQLSNFIVYVSHNILNKTNQRIVLNSIDILDTL